MRWNCPHCSTLVNLKIDLDQNPKAYVRCGKCMGIALIQKKSHSEVTASTEKDLAKSFSKARESIREETMSIKQSEAAILNNYTETHDQDDDDKTLLLNRDMNESMSLDANGNATYAPSEKPGNPTREFQARTSLPMPPAFLTSSVMTGNAYSKNIPPASTLYSTFHVDMDYENEKSRNQFRNALIITLSVSAFLGGLYFFVRAQKSMSENQIKVEKLINQIKPAAPAQSTDQLAIQSSSALKEIISVVPKPKPRPQPPEIPPLTDSLYTARVIVPHAILRSEPNKDSTAIDHFSENDLLKIQKQFGNWIKVEGRNSKIGWIRADLLKF